MPEAIATWLQQLGGEQYVSLFEDHDIGFEVLPGLDRDVPENIGIGSAGHRLRILCAAA